MTNVVLTLGGVAFQDMEVPEAISFGGKQRLAVQNLIGGGRIVQALGLDDGIINFGGIFSGSDAVARAQYFDVARASGAALPLVWDEFYYTVVIQEFDAEYRKNTLIPFRISCAVVNDALANKAVINAAVADLISNDLAAAAGFSAQAGLSSAIFSVSSTDTISSLQNSLVSDGSQLNSLITLQNKIIDQTTDPTSGATSVIALMGSFGQAAAVSQMQGYVGRAATNLENFLL